MKKIVLAVCLSLIFALFWLWVYYIKYPVREPGLKELLLANSGHVYLAEDFNRDSEWSPEMKIMLNEGSTPQQKTQYREDRSILSGLNYFPKDKLTQFPQKPIFIINNVFSVNNIPYRDMHQLSGNEITLYQVLGDLSPIYSFKYPESFFESFRVSWEFRSFTAKDGSMLFLWNRSYSLRGSGYSDEQICRDGVPSVSIIPWWGTETFRREGQVIVDNTIWYTVDAVEQDEDDDGRMLSSYAYNRCMVKGNRLYVLSLSSDNPLNSDLIRQITPTLKSF